MIWGWGPMYPLFSGSSDAVPTKHLALWTSELGFIWGRQSWFRSKEVACSVLLVVESTQTSTHVQMKLASSLHYFFRNLWWHYCILDLHRLLGLQFYQAAPNTGFCIFYSGLLILMFQWLVCSYLHEISNIFEKKRKKKKKKKTLCDFRLLSSLFHKRNFTNSSV